MTEDLMKVGGTYSRWRKKSQFEYKIVERRNATKMVEGKSPRRTVAIQLASRKIFLASKHEREGYAS